MTFEGFLDAELDGLRHFARVLTGDRQGAHDVLAEALVQAFIRWEKIERMDNPSAYVRRMITNGFLMDRRSWWRRHTQSEAAELPAATGGLQDGVDDRLELDWLLRMLPKQQRAAVVLRYYLDVSDQEIAELLGCSAGAARTYISRGLKSMRISNSDQTTSNAPNPAVVINEY